MDSKPIRGIFYRHSILNIAANGQIRPNGESNDSNSFTDLANPETAEELIISRKDLSEICKRLKDKPVQRGHGKNEIAIGRVVDAYVVDDQYDYTGYVEFELDDSEASDEIRGCWASRDKRRWDELSLGHHPPDNPIHMAICDSGRRPQTVILASKDPATGRVQTDHMNHRESGHLLTELTPHRPRGAFPPRTGLC